MKQLCYPFVMACLLAGAAPPESSAPTTAPDIVVEGLALDQIDAFVENLTQARGDHQLARWNSRICVGVMGADVHHARYLTARIGQIARRERISVASKRCRPNILVVVTDQADRFAQLALDRHPRLFGDRSERLNSPRRTAAWLTDHPVRWINMSVRGGADGMPPQDGGDLGQINVVRSFSRVRQNIRENASGALILVDSVKAQGATWQQIADYVAMVALTHPAPDASYGKPPTILSLFKGDSAAGTRPAELTAWDRKFLSALYRSDEVQSARAQRREIGARIERAHAEETAQGNPGPPGQ